MHDDVDRDRLNRLVEKSITKVFKDALSLMEMSGVNPEQYKRIRRMVLRSGNDEIRKLKDELDKFDVKYTPRYDEEIEFDQ